MTVSLTGRLDEQVKTYVAATGGTMLLTSTLGDTMYVSMKNYRRLQIWIIIADGTTVTGSTVTLKQATAVAGTGEKELAFSTVYKNVDYAAAKTLTATAVTSNTFTTQAVNSKISVYMMEVDSESLDVSGGFDCVRVDGTGHAATTPVGVCVIYNLWGARFSGAEALLD